MTPEPISHSQSLGADADLLRAMIQAGRDALPTNGSASRRRGFRGRYEASSTLSVEARRGRMIYFTASLAASFAACAW
jgi:hypothetical protein